LYVSWSFADLPGAFADCDFRLEGVASPDPRVAILGWPIAVLVCFMDAIGMLLAHASGCLPAVDGAQWRRVRLLLREVPLACRVRSLCDLVRDFGGEDAEFCLITPPWL